MIGPVNRATQVITIRFERSAIAFEHRKGKIFHTWEAEGEMDLFGSFSLNFSYELLIKLIFYVRVNRVTRFLISSITLH